MNLKCKLFGHSTRPITDEYGIETHYTCTRSKCDYKVPRIAWNETGRDAVVAVRDVYNGKIKKVSYCNYIKGGGRPPLNPLHIKRIERGDKSYVSMPIVDGCLGCDFRDGIPGKLMLPKCDGMECIGIIWKLIKAKGAVKLVE